MYEDYKYHTYPSQSRNDQFINISLNTKNSSKIPPYDDNILTITLLHINKGIASF